MKSALKLSCLLLLFSSTFCRAGDVPYTLSVETFVLTYSSAGQLHDDIRRWDMGLVARASHPITARLHASVSGFLGILSEFKFIGVGLTYQFVPSVMSKVTDSQPFEVLMYYKWRPFIRVEGGLLSGQTMVNAGLVHQQVVEDSMGLHGSGGVAYAINAKLEMTASAFTFYGLSPDINFLSFGVTFGVRYNLF